MRKSTALLSKQYSSLDSLIPRRKFMIGAGAELLLLRHPAKLHIAFNCCNAHSTSEMGQVRAKKLRPGCVRCSSDNRRNGNQAALTLRARRRLLHRSKKYRRRVCAPPPDQGTRR
jgi:hypothetical protein